MNNFRGQNRGKRSKSVFTKVSGGGTSVSNPSVKYTDIIPSGAKYVKIKSISFEIDAATLDTTAPHEVEMTVLGRNAVVFANNSLGPDGVVSFKGKSIYGEMTNVALLREWLSLATSDSGANELVRAITPGQVFSVKIDVEYVE